MASQRDVAKKAGVSFMTVSRVINKKINVDENTRQKVLKAIRELGYYPNVLGRGLNRNKTEAIGVVIPTCSHLFSTQYYLELLRGVEQYCAIAGYGMLLYPARDDSGMIDYQKLYQERRVDGMLIIAPPVKDDQLKIIVKKKVPFVVLDGHQAGSSDKRIVFVDADNRGGASEAVQYLIDQGHKKIAHIAGWKTVANGRDRLFGYKSTLKKNGISHKDDYIREGDFTEITGYYKMKDLLGLKDRPTAVFAANDLMAIGAIRAVQETGLGVPGDISIVGFDDIPSAKYSNPPLTTVHQMTFQMGFEAVKLLIENILQDKWAESRVMETKLVVRESVKSL
ncbi:MAG: LacI family DNA-binding transcriptional regulator [Spirochaetes bacterium]|nr:LacI family DNA-binding transcriptional regulator [Spirochaetota bacterium]